MSMTRAGAAALDPAGRTVSTSTGRSWAALWPVGFLVLTAWITLPILAGYTGPTGEDEAGYFEAVVTWFESGSPANGYQTGITRTLFVQPPGWRYFLAPFYAVLGFGYLTVRLAFVLQALLFAVLLSRVSRRAGLGLLTTAAVFGVAITSPSLLPELGRMDFLAGLLLACCFYTLEDEPSPTRDLRAGILLGLAGSVHLLPGITGALGLVPAVGLGKNGVKRLGWIGAAAAATVSVFWVPFLWGHWDSFRGQFGGYTSIHTVPFRGIGRMGTFARINPVVFGALAVAAVTLALARERRALLAAREYRVFAVPLVLMVAVVLSLTISHFYLLNYLIPLASLLLLSLLAPGPIPGAASGRWAVGRAAALAALLVALLLTRGPLAYDPLLIAFNRGASPEKVYGEIVRASIAPGSFVVAEPVVYYAVRPLARELQELEAYARREGPAGYAKVDYLVLSERQGDLFYRFQDEASREYVEHQFVPVADRRVSVRRLSLRGVFRGRFTEDQDIGRLVVLRNRRAITSAVLR